MGSTPRRISASRGAGILGLSKWKTPVDVWLELMTEEYPEFKDECMFQIPERVETVEMKWGTAFEDAIIELAIDKLHEQSEYKIPIFSMTNREKFYSCDKKIITCHIDGIYRDYQKTKDIALHEGKTTTAWTFANEWGEPGTGNIPQDYQIQVQHQMMLAGFDTCYVSVLIFPRRQSELEELNGIDKIRKKKKSRWTEALNEMGFFHQYEVFANPALQRLMKEKYYEFWERYIVGKTPPPAQNYSDIRKLITMPSGTIVATDQIERWSAEYKDLGAEMNEAKKRREQLKTQILSAMEKMAKTEDIESADKWILRDRRGKKLHQYSEKGFR
jgi:predicted phage-related endonuclease